MRLAAVVDDDRGRAEGEAELPSDDLSVLVILGLVLSEAANSVEAVRRRQLREVRDWEDVGL